MSFNNVTLSGDITNSGITLAGDISHTVVSLEPIDTINYTAAKWGYIQGTLSDQTDLINLLNLKADAGSLATVATSGDYSDLSNLPTIPTKTSDLTNDSDFVESTDLATVATSGDYTDLTNTPTIPTKTSDLTNDSGFLTSAPVSSVNGQTGAVTLSIPTKTSDLTNDSGFITSVPTEIFWASNYPATTIAELNTAYNANKLILVNDTLYGTIGVLAKKSGNKYTFQSYTSDANKTDYVIFCDNGVWGVEYKDIPTVPVSSVDGKTGNVVVIPTGGTQGQVLAKASATDRDVEWVDQSGGGATEIFIATYGSNHYASIKSAYSSGKMVFAVYDGRLYSLATVSSETYPTYGFISVSDSTIYNLSCSTSNNGMSTNWFALSSSQVTSVNGQTGAVTISNATTNSAGLMSADDKSHLDAVYADYSSAITALGA